MRLLFKVALLTGTVGWGATHAQTLYSRDAKITISANTTVSIRGAVENEGTIENNGHLKVAGSWVNSGMYVAGAGEITFNSTSRTVPQVIHHNGQTFNRLTIAGGTKKIILSDLVVSKEINFNHGIVEAAGDSRMILDAEVQIESASDSSHVHGVVFHKGSGHKVFPIGNGLSYLPVEFPEIRDPSAFIGVQAFEFDNVELAMNRSLEAISDKRYWYIDVASGSLTNSPVILPLEGESTRLDPDKIVVVQAGSPTEEFTSIGRATSQQQNARSDGRIRSEMSVSMPFIALATTATDISLVVHNAVSNNGDGLNDFLTIENIDKFPMNKFSVFSRWGDKLFEIENYDNLERVFRGRANINSDSDLVSGTYFYVLDIPGAETLRGFIAIKNH